VHDLFPILFTDKVLENVGGWEAYSFTDGFMGYHQVQIIEEYQEKTTFTVEWGFFVYTIMCFVLKNSPAFFSWIVVTAFKEFIYKFLEFYSDDCKMFNLLKEHMKSLHLML